MKCPSCGSDQVYEKRYQTPLIQVACMNCNRDGTYSEFGVQSAYTKDLAPQFEGSVYLVEHSLFEGDDDSATAAITVHKIDERSACNVWIRSFGQWLKFIPEHVIEIPPSPDMLVGELLWFTNSHRELLNLDLRWRLTVIALQDKAMDLIRQNNS